MRPRSVRSALAAAVTVAALACAGGLAPTATATATAAEPVTPVIAAPLPQRTVVPVKGSDGRWHVMYELVLTNTLASRARIDALQVLAAGSGRTVARYGPRAIVAGELLHGLDRVPARSTVLRAGQTQVLLLSLPFTSRRAIPRAFEHRVAVTARDAFTSRTTRLRYVTARVTISPREAPVLTPPLRGRGWVASDGCCGSGGHVSAIFGLAGQLQAAERFAIDWIKLTPEGRFFDGDPSVLTNWAGYGAEITAAADGVVTSARDGLPDQTPLAKPGVLPLDEVPGNHVMIRMRGGLSGVYAHFVPGTVAVRVGQRVRAGDRLGLLGNSGGSLAPHLHFHVVNGSSMTASDGYPFTLARFGIAGQAGLPQLMAALRGEAAFPRPGSTRAVEHRDELPLGFTIDDFPG